MFAYCRNNPVYRVDASGQADVGAQEEAFDDDVDVGPNDKELGGGGGGNGASTGTTGGSSLSQMTVGSNTLYFAYDASGTPMSVTYNGTNYYYATNIQGDVTAILNTSGTAVVQYTYDAWGKILTTTGSMASTLGAHNPLRYRGYVYDTESTLYYLQSRYYDPELGRFINADAYASTGQGILGNNMFAYCRNNPVYRVDASGQADVGAQEEAFDDDVDVGPNDKEIGGGGTGGGIAAGGTNGDGSRSNPYIGGSYEAGQHQPNNPGSNPQYQAPSGGGGVTKSITVNGVQVDFGHGGRHVDASKYNIDDIMEVIAYDATTHPANPGTNAFVNIKYDGYPIEYRFYTFGSQYLKIGTFFFTHGFK